MTQADVNTSVQSGTARRMGPMEPLPRVKGWELAALAAEGSLARVYQARPAGAPADTPAAYALKMLRPEWQQDPRAIALVQREALVGRRVTHPHLIAVLSAGTREPPHFVLMPWLAGNTLADQLLDKKGIEPPLAFWIARQVAEALQALHEAGWMHGDVKPSNIFVSPEGHVTLLDLGFARRTDRPEPAIERCVTGTCNYLAPETLSPGHRPDTRGDLYSLGVVLFEMLSGRLPFEAPDAATVARLHRTVRAPDLAQLMPELPTEAHVLVQELLAKQALRRPATPREVVDRVIPLEIATLPRRWAG